MQRALYSSVWPSVALATLLMSMVMPAWALYKVVGPDGKVTYTDRPPADRPAQTLKSNGSLVSTEGLPYELQRIVGRFPVTLYTGNNCSPCETARQLLKTRGVPYTEKTVISADDIKALLRLESTDQLPVARIGQKQLLGFTHQDWQSYLDAAGYPTKSSLPLNYRWPAASPLVPVETKPADQGAASRTAPANDNTNPPSGSAPSGFRF